MINLTLDQQEYLKQQNNRYYYRKATSHNWYRKPSCVNFRNRIKAQIKQLIKFLPDNLLQKDLRRQGNSLKGVTLRSTKNSIEQSKMIWVLIEPKMPGRPRLDFWINRPKLNKKLQALLTKLKDCILICQMK